MSPAPARSKTSWTVPIAILAITALLIALVIGVNQGDNSADSDAEESGAAEVHTTEQAKVTEGERREKGDLLAQGPVDAPVVLVMFSDYQCPFCAKWTKDTLPAMLEYAEEGDLRIEMRDVNVYGPNSERASLASWAAAQQDAYWEYHSELFPDGDTRSEDELSKKALTELAKDLDLDVDQFTTDLESDEAAEAIARNEELGAKLGATSTPVFTVGGKPIVGAQPTEVFTEAVDDALAEAK